MHTATKVVYHTQMRALRILGFSGKKSKDKGEKAGTQKLRKPQLNTKARQARFLVFLILCKFLARIRYALGYVYSALLLTGIYVVNIFRTHISCALISVIYEPNF